MLVGTKSRFRLFGNRRRRASAPVGPYFADGVSIGNRPFTADWQETSGICRPQRGENAGHIWCESDGSVNKLFSLRTSDCAARGEWTLTGATPTDLEDISSATVNGQPYIYLADMGDNGNSRATFNIYRIKEPITNGSNGSLAAGTDYETIVCQYPAGDIPSHKDAETLLADPDTGDLYIVMKRFTPAKVYRLAHAASYSGTQTLESLGTIWTAPFATPYDGANGGYYVGGDISADGREIILKNHASVFYFARNKATQTIVQALQAAGTDVPAYVGGGRPASYPNNEPQGEGICFTDPWTWFSASEAGVPDRTAASASNYPVFKYTRLAKPYTEVSFQDGTNGYTGTLDTYIQVTTPTTPHGTETTFVVDLDAADERLGLLKFDLSSIPTNATIVGCDLYLAITTEGQDFALYRCFVPWDENSTYSTVNGGAGIPRNGVAASSLEDAVHGAPASVAANHGYDAITGTVRIKIPPQTIKDWIDGTKPNYGWVLINVGTSLDGFQFGSRQNATQGNRPRLVVRYLL
jgi:hypothetical protein